ncbi:hypothetical protein [Plebeiibacterium marinum]|uniref:Uncharacterized protein n=1 Tax=Plebeiibacterium marinum TaxID=2992111 RepID=A0AAE3SL01_9BACT|nr:hypothetical protein [Plebeiobacterium marinum]MCW3807068.1 hypothetical protein [Plebeiobacterium marinum]
MVKNYKSLLENQAKRMNPDKIEIQRSLFEELQRTPHDDLVQYIKKAMFGGKHPVNHA